MAESLGRAPSTVSREISRNNGRRRYRATLSEQAAWDRAHRAKRCKLAQNRRLARVVASKLQLELSLQQIAGWLEHKYPADENYQVSHETIYRNLYVQASGALKKERDPAPSYTAHDASFHATATGAAERQGPINAMVAISERPASIED